MKPTANFKLSKTSKRFLATITGSEKKGMLKKGLIEAELYAAVVPKREPRKEGPRPVNGADSVDLT
jgi:hypothetical protein